MVNVFSREAGVRAKIVVNIPAFLVGIWSKWRVFHGPVIAGRFKGYL